MATPESDHLTSGFLASACSHAASASSAAHPTMTSPLRCGELGLGPIKHQEEPRQGNFLPRTSPFWREGSVFLARREQEGGHRGGKPAILKCLSSSLDQGRGIIVSKKRKRYNLHFFIFLCNQTANVLIWSPSLSDCVRMD
jgi:hypothetical protein